jgi:hypothetical protein
LAASRNNQVFEEEKELNLDSADEALVNEELRKLDKELVLEKAASTLDENSRTQRLSQNMPSVTKNNETQRATT